MAVPKRRKSRANTHARRSQWKTEIPTLVKTEENGRTVYRMPHRARRPAPDAGHHAGRDPHAHRMAGTVHLAL